MHSPLPLEPATGVRLEVQNLHKHYGNRQVLRGTQLVVEPGQFIAVIGRSGCGKSTLLRLLAGLETPGNGTLQLDGQDINGLHADTRLLFQEPRLLPWRRVLGNVTLGLPAGAASAGRQALAQVGLAERAQDWPAQLSGGQRQRVALARALLHQPRLLLLDEPLGALDALTRIGMQRLIERVWQRHRFTALLVTHDVQEAVMLADRVILIEDGLVALDQAIPMARPRAQGDPAFAALEMQVLDRVLHGDASAA